MSRPQSRPQIGVIGNGMVGGAVGNGFRTGGLLGHLLRRSGRYHHTVRAYDIDSARQTHPFDEVVTLSDIIFVAVPTPSDTHGIDLSYLDDTMEDIAPHVIHTPKIVALKSTAIPGTTRTYIERYPGMNIAFVPEFLREKYAINDFIHATRHVIGADDQAVKDALFALHKNQFPRSQVLTMSPEEAEIVKYASNTQLAISALVANMMFDVCQAHGADYQNVLAGQLPDPRISRWIQVAPDGQRGVGGVCFPKDLRAITAHMESLSKMISDFELAEALEAGSFALSMLEKYNFLIRDDHDWERNKYALRS